MRSSSKYAQNLDSERSLTSYIPYSSHVSPNTLASDDGDFLRTWKVGGISFETQDADEIFIQKNQLNTLLRSIGSSNVAIWIHNVRRQTYDNLEAIYDNDFCRNYHKKYNDSFDGYRMMANEIYLTLIYRPYPSRIEKTMSRASRRSHDEILNDQAASLEALDELSFQVESSLKKYEIENLSNYHDENEILCSQQLTFLNFLLTGEWQKVRVPKAPLNSYLGNAWLFAGTETIELRSPTKVRYAQGIDFKDYSSHTEPGILNGLMYEDYEYVITQSFSFMDKSKGKKFLETQQKQLENTEDGSVTQIKEMSAAIDQLIQGQFAMGEYHFTMMIFGESVNDVAKNRTSAMSIIQNLGFMAALINTATDAAFYAQLPCNWSYRPRVAGLTSLNFAGLACLHNFSAGKRDNNPWGQCVTIFKSPSGQPLYFNYHASNVDEMSIEKKLLGNTRIIGQSGAGKTVLMGHLLCQSRKYKTGYSGKYSNVFFDKDRGAELVIRRIGGKYLAIKNGVPTGFNPLQLPKTEHNVLFLEDLVHFLVKSDGMPLNSSDSLKLNDAVRSVMEMPKQIRRLSTLLQNITESTDRESRENSLTKRLSKWCFENGSGRPGSLWWVLDCPEDLIEFDENDLYGFDGTDFLDNPTVRTPISLYLLYRMESIIDGRRFIYYMDEAWKWVDDPAFGTFVGDKQLTIRKQNGLGVFSTQMPSSLLKSKPAAELVQQIATEIYLPNPKADYEEYTKGFKVTDQEFEIITNLSEDSRMFILKQGLNSSIGVLDLNGFDDELAILSGSTDNIELLDEIMAEVGEDPEVWEPIFHKRRKERILPTTQGV